jgi:S-adenosylmethionine:tRNA ribosyltransferase-isomerase
MKLSDFDYTFSEELIATHPTPARDDSRMMVVNRSEQSVKHSSIRDFPLFLRKDDCVVINDTRVFSARLMGKKESGGKIEILLLREKSSVIPAKAGIQNSLKLLDPRLRVDDKCVWRCITNQTKASKTGQKIIFDDGLIGTIISRDGDELLIEFNKPELIEKVGLPPLPPYILKARSRKQETGGMNDKQRYQTIYAKHTGSAAAPTAGLHLTDKLLQKIKETGAKIATVTLHVGLDTFSPVRVDNIEDHKMHGEEYFVPEETVKSIEKARQNGGRVIAVGTTTVRALESGVSDSGLITDHKPLTTHLFIIPGYKFRIVDCILTNFHQPKSTLLMMVAAFAGRKFILNAYNEAISQKYRLFSYGDCMLING